MQVETACAYVIHKSWHQKPFRRRFVRRLFSLQCGLRRSFSNLASGFLVSEDKRSVIPELENTVNMPSKGVSTRLNPVRLQTIPHLRVRRPNQHEQNPCVTVMSSMLSMCLLVCLDLGDQLIVAVFGNT